MSLTSSQNYKGNILVVDDTPDNLRLLSAMLTGQGYEVRKALNGKMALTACQMVLPDIILLDINMPGMDGYEVCQQLKANESTSQIPVIFISALDDVLDKVKAFDVGGVDYITKPFHGQEVIVRIENQINLRLLQINLQEKNLLLQQALDNLKLAQVQQIQNAKMVALGEFVAGIAHEVNNPISFIYGNLEYANQYMQDLVDVVKVYQQEYPNPTPKLEKKIQDIDLNFLVKDLQDLMNAMHRGADRIRSIVLALQNFSRHHEAQIKKVDIHEGIDSILLMLEHRLQESLHRPKIEVVKEYGNLPLVSCYPSELNQVFMHILNNAVDALEQGVGKAFIQDYENRQCTEKWKDKNDLVDESAVFSQSSTPQIRIYTETDNHNCVKICIADNGCGIPELVRSRVFEPFFTTKPVNKGSGLGLSISYQIIVQKHQGQLECISSTGGGAEFLIKIPVGEEPLS
jgi:signal transduction histidine kinase